jgi:hypothetical protein
MRLVRLHAEAFRMARSNKAFTGVRPITLTLCPNPAASRVLLFQRRSMSELGQKRRFDGVPLISGLSQ